MNLALAVAFAVVASAEPSSVFSGAALSLGPGYRVTGRLTFDRRKAATGGYIYAAPRLSMIDAEAVRLSQAVLTASPGVLAPGAILARRHRVPALAMPQAYWEAGALVLRQPVFGAKVGSQGVTLRVAERFLPRRLQEDEVVAVDPVNGLLILFEPDQRPFELDLAQALRAYDGLKDAQALIQWYEARRDSGAALAARLAEELTARVAAGTTTGAEFKRVMSSATRGLGSESQRGVDEAARRASAREQKALTRALEDLAQGVEDAGTVEAVDRMAAQARRAAVGAKALAAAVGSPGQSRVVEASAQRLAERARARRASLREAAHGPAAALSAAGATTPVSATIPAALYERFLAQTGLSPLLADVAGDASLDLRRKAERIAALFSAAELKGDSELGLVIERRLPRAPALSISGPDGGQARVPAKRALEAVKEVWALSWGAGPLGERKRKAAALSAPELVVEAVARAEISGSAFSRDPVGGSRRAIVIEAVWGEADALAAGLAAGDQYTLDRRSLSQALPALIADKREKLELDAETGVLKRVVVPAGLSWGRCLTAAQLQRVGRAARALDDHLGHGVELRFAFSEDRLVALGWTPLR